MAKRKPTRYTVTDGKMVLILEVAEEGGYCITCPFDPGLITEAETLEEAFEMAYDAAGGLKVARANLHRPSNPAGPTKSALPETRKKTPKKRRSPTSAV